MTVVRSRSWVWFFLILGTLAVAGLSVEIWFNLNQQLTPEKLAEAQARWQANGPRDYTIDYEIKQDNNPDPAPRTPDRYTVRVEDGHVVSATGASRTATGGRCGPVRQHGRPVPPCARADAGRPRG